MGRHARGAPTFASEGEDRAIRLGVVLVLFAFASFSTLALCWMRPALQRRARSREDNCSVARVDAGDGGAAGPAGEPCFFSCGPACRGDSRYPCVRVFARLAHSPGRVALLHQDLLQLSLNPRVRAGGQGGWVGVMSGWREIVTGGIKKSGRRFREFSALPFATVPLPTPREITHTARCLLSLPPPPRRRRDPSLRGAPQCSYVPASCHRDPSENARNVSGWAVRWLRSLELSASFPCYFDGQLRPDDVILDRDDTRAVVFHCVFWPFLTLLVGLLLIGLATCAKSLAVRAEAMRKLKKLR
uniref:Calcium-activated potassium channel subunit beta-4-like n=1 Tax=Petromyzon marinus TaxID=7757 RepID=A0AAJ7UHN1_PETMA|nr:calcium-activated potassium channel subunit beta-4-like [Petromyzon marinus]